MSEEIRCPNCGSKQVTAQKHGFSAGKAVAGAVLTGGIGVLAGLHGSNDIDVTCLSCGHKWNPKKLYDQQLQDARQKEFADSKKWRQAIYRAYENKDFAQAEAIYLSKQSFNQSLPDIHTVYKFYKKQFRILNIVAAVVMIVFIAIMSLILNWIF
jgi:hypothetical protein